MNLTEDIHSLTDFKRNTAEFLRQLKETGQPRRADDQWQGRAGRAGRRILPEALRRSPSGWRRSRPSRRAWPRSNVERGRPMDDVFDALEKDLRRAKPAHDVPRGHPASRRTGHPFGGSLDSRKVGVAGDDSAFGAQPPCQDCHTEGQPRRCPIDPDSEVYGEEVRVLLYGKRRGVYRVLFTIRGDTVHVLAVRHAAQQSLAEEMGEDNRDGGELRLN